MIITSTLSNVKTTPNVEKPNKRKVRGMEITENCATTFFDVNKAVIKFLHCVQALFLEHYGWSKYYPNASRFLQNTCIPARSFVGIPALSFEFGWKNVLIYELGRAYRIVQEPMSCRNRSNFFV